jgi:hypothetical protein
MISPGIPERVAMKKKAGQPTDMTRYPEVGAMRIRPNAARDESIAY